MTIKQTAQDIDWYQMIVTDKRGLTGASVVEFVSPLVHKLNASSVGLSDLVGAISDLKDYEGRVLSSDDFLRKAADATQFDWAFLFLYVRGSASELAGVADDKQAILQADLTIRLADDTYFYVYGRDQELMNDLRRRYPEAEFKVSKFSELDVPY